MLFDCLIYTMSSYLKKLLNILQVYTNLYRHVWTRLLIYIYIQEQEYFIYKCVHDTIIFVTQTLSTFSD